LFARVMRLEPCHLGIQCI